MVDFFVFSASFDISCPCLLEHVLALQRGEGRNVYNMKRLFILPLAKPASSLVFPNTFILKFEVTLSFFFFNFNSSSWVENVCHLNL